MIAAKPAAAGYGSRLTLFAVVLTGVMTVAVCINVLLLQPAGEGAAQQRHRSPAANESASGAPQSGTASSVTLGATTTPPVPAPGTKAETIRAIQRELSQLGYDAGTADGVLGMQTRVAILGYELDNGLSLTGVPADDILRHILMGGSTGTASARTDDGAIKRRQLLRGAQLALRQLKYDPGRTDGIMTPGTEAAIRAYERDHRMVPTGALSGKLLARLSRSSSAGTFALPMQ